MKIFQITQAFGGGVFFSVSNICNGLSEQGHEVTLIFSEREELPKDYQKYLRPNIKLTPLPMCTSIHPWYDLKSLAALYKIFKKNKPDVIHLHSSKAGALGRVAAWMAGLQKNTFYSPRGLAFLRKDVSSFQKALFEKIEWLLAKFGGQIIACSQSELQEVQVKVSSERAVLIENAVDMSPIPEKNYELQTQHIVIGTVGRISPQKNPREFLELAKKFNNNGVKFIWVGGGGEGEILKEFKDIGIEVTGWVTRQEVLKILGQMDIYVQTSLWEGMPLAVIEAQAAGVPTVVRNAVGNRDVVSSGENGFIVDDFPQLEKFVGQLIDNAEMRKRLGQNARSTALKRFSLDRLLSELVPLYEAACAKQAMCETNISDKKAS
jgi:Glycosyltransferase